MSGNDPKAAAQAALYVAVEAGDAPGVGTRWRHYKGGAYTVLACAIEEATLAPVVVYQSHKHGTVWTRPLAAWREPVEHNGATVPRFAPIGGAQ